MTFTKQENNKSGLIDKKVVKEVNMSELQLQADELNQKQMREEEERKMRRSTQMLQYNTDLKNTI